MAYKNKSDEIKYREKHREERIAYYKQWRKENPNYAKKYSKKYYIEHREELNKNSKIIEFS